MLYDNAQLLYQYTQADILSPSPLFRKIIIETADWTMREMQSTEGGYFSALYADSEDKEGKYYLWTSHQAISLLSRPLKTLNKSIFPEKNARNYLYFPL